MTRLLVYTGKGGAGVSTCAASTAKHIGDGGTQTALVSIDRKGTMSDVFGVDIGPEPTAVGPSLTAVEINPQAGQQTYRETFERIAGVASVAGIDFRDGHVADLLESTHVPFGREVAALEAVASFVGDAEYEAVVFDTGLHGRVLRLLRMPGLLGMGLDIASMAIEEVGDRVDATADRLVTTSERVVDPLMAPFGPDDWGPGTEGTPDEDGDAPTGGDTSGDGADGADGSATAAAEAERELLESRVATVREILGGAGDRELRVVSTPDRLAARPTDHLVRNLRNAGIPAGPLVVNKVIEDGSCCPRCAAIREAQQRELDDLAGREGLSLRIVPDLHGEVTGEAMLDSIADALHQPEGDGSDGGRAAGA